MTGTSAGDVELTADQLRAEATEIARTALGCGLVEAYERLDRGMYRGTLAASRLSALRWLLEGAE